MPENHEPQRHTGTEPAGARNMHEDTQPWDDACSCEPEPRWQSLEDEEDQAEDKPREE